MTGFCKCATGFVGAVAIAMGAAAVQAQSAHGSAKTAAAEASGAKVPELGLIDVQQSNLLQKVAKDNWPTYNGEYSGWRYSGLSQVTPANVRHLAAKWVFHTENAGILQVTPVVVNGVMFITGSNDMYALDAQNGKLLWHHTWPITEGLIDDAAGHINRGVAVLGTRVYMQTDDAHLLCLDARSGSLIWDRAYATGNRNYGATAAPLIVKNLVLVGSSGGDEGVRGFVAAYDAQTGKQVWRHWTIPAPGEFGSKSWPGDMYKHGCGSIWLSGTYDPELNTVYMGTGNPCPDYEGSLRPGDDLYTASLIALDPDTGQQKWYFQFTPHDLYDYDAVQTDVLIDAKFKGQPRKLVVTANKNGFLYILDRTNGKYLYAKQFATMNWAKGLDANGRPILNNLIPDQKGATVCPTSMGGSNWFSPSYDPETNTFYFRSLDACSVFRAKMEQYQQGQTWYATGESRPEGNSPNAAYINAFNLNKLAFTWRDKLIGREHAVAGVMTTAGGLVAFGNDEQEFEIDDARTGKPLWVFNLGQPMHASPMSYGIGGKQYFAVAAGDDVFAFALP